VRVLLEPEPPDLPSIAKYLVRYANTGDDQRAAVAEGLRDALGGTPTARQTAAALQQLIPAIAEEFRAHPNVRGLDSVRNRPDGTPAREPVDGWELFETEIATNPCADDVARHLHDAAAALRHLRGTNIQDAKIAAVQRALGTPAAAGLAAALVHVTEHEPQLVARLRDVVLPEVYRQPIGERLRSVPFE
jgi:hypothetical protein